MWTGLPASLGKQKNPLISGFNNQLNLDSAVELVERVVANGVIGVGKKFVVTLLVMRIFLP
jgi:hypothetical protein